MSEASDGLVEGSSTARATPLHGARPWRGPLFLGAGALVLAVLVAFLGTVVVGGQSLGGDFPAADVIIDGSTLSASRQLQLDLSQPLRTWLVPGGPSATRARLSFLVAGHSVYSAGAQFQKAPVGPEHVALINATVMQYVLAGPLTVELTLTGTGGPGHGGSVVGRWRFIGRAAEPSILSLLGVVVVVLGLFSLACIGECARSIVRRRRWLRDGAVASVSLCLFVLSMTGVAWLLAGRQPSLAEVVVSAVLAIISGPCLLAAYYRLTPE